MTSYQQAVAASGLKPTAKHVALTVSLHADWKTGENAHPGAPRLVKETGYVERTVRATLATLVDSGWLKLVARGGRAGGKREANTYSLVIPKHALRCTHAGESPMQEKTESLSSDAPHLPETPQPVTSPDDSRGVPAPVESLKRARKAVPKRTRSGQVTPIFKTNGNRAL